MILLSIIGVCILYAWYQIYGEDFVADKIRIIKERKKNKDSVARIALVKMVSDSPKDIEKFIVDNASYLSDDLVKKLVVRIEAIKDDKIITDDSLKTRIDNLPQKKA